MKNMTLVMLENRQGYGERLAAFISRQTDSPFNVHLYLEHPIGDEQWEKADVVLMTSSLMDLYGEKVSNEKVILLDEEGRQAEGENEYVYKYQSAVKIYGEILKCCADKGNAVVPMGSKGRKWMLTGIYMPVSSEKRVRSVLEFCRKEGENQKVLYLNLEPVTCFTDLLESGDRKEGISEMIYYVKQRQDNLGTRLGMMVTRAEFDYLMPSANPAEIGELNAEDWQFCLEQLYQGTVYDQVIFDFGAMLPPAVLLEAGDRWIIAGDETEWEEKLTERFISIVSRMTEGSLEERVLKIREVVP